jgi:hypothetical protein
MIHEAILHRGRLGVSGLGVEKGLISLTTTTSQTVAWRYLLDPLSQEARGALPEHLSHGPCRLHGTCSPQKDSLIIGETPLEQPHFYLTCYDMT